MGTNDAVSVLGGSPYNNKRPYKWYSGSLNDFMLNKKIERIKTSEWYQARNEVFQNYHPNGDLDVPLVTLHTTGDHVALYWNELIYSYKVWQNRSFRFYTHIPVKRYGHCNFTIDEVLAALSVLQYKTTKQVIPFPVTADYISDDLRNKIEELIRQYCSTTKYQNIIFR